MRYIKKIFIKISLPKFSIMSKNVYHDEHKSEGERERNIERECTHEKKKKIRLMRGCTPARNMGFMSVWQMTNAEPPRWTYGHRLKAEPTKSLTTLLGLGQKSLVNGSRDFFSQIPYLLPAIYFVAAIRALSLSSWHFISHIGHILIIPRVFLSLTV